MKKHLLMMLGIAMTIISCKKEMDKTSGPDLARYNRNLKRLTSVVGRMHNDGVTVALKVKGNSFRPNLQQSLFPTTPSNPTPTLSYYQSADVKNLNNAIYDYVLAQPEFSGSGRGIITEVVPKVISIVYAQTSQQIDSKVDSTVLSLRQNNILSIREAGMIKEIQDIFMDGYSLNMNQSVAGPYFSNKLNQLKNKYINIIWDINEGEAFLGALEIAISSNQYWHSNTAQVLPIASKVAQHKLMSIDKTGNLLLPPFTPDDPETPIVQVDLVAYLLSWGWQVYNQYMAGTLDSSGQYDRISRGLQAAISASTLRLIKTSMAVLNDDMFNGVDGGTLPGGGVTPTYNFPSPLTTDFVYYTNQYTHIGSNYRPPFITTRIYAGNNFYYFDSSLTRKLPDGYYILQEDLSTNKYYQVSNGVVIAINTATNNPDAPLGPWDPYNPFEPTLVPAN
ncbi:hypothetical protein [Pedobacter terrae]|uniref:hypothetical protein n=1 Tax=Pedobacter terrae TaxID=405671 RepID=UPI002FFB3D98